MRIRYQQDQQSVQHTSIMSNKPFVFTLCDAGNTKVEDLRHLCMAISFSLRPILKAWATFLRSLEFEIFLPQQPICVLG